MIIELTVRAGYSFEVLVSARCEGGKIRYSACLAEVGTFSVINPRDPGEGETIEQAVEALAAQLAESIGRLLDA